MAEHVERVKQEVAARRQEATRLKAMREELRKREEERGRKRDHLNTESLSGEPARDRVKENNSNKNPTRQVGEGHNATGRTTETTAEAAPGAQKGRSTRTRGTTTTCRWAPATPAPGRRTRAAAGSTRDSTNRRDGSAAPPTARAHPTTESPRRPRASKRARHPAQQGRHHHRQGLHQQEHRGVGRRKGKASTRETTPSGPTTKTSREPS